MVMTMKKEEEEEEKEKSFPAKPKSSTFLLFFLLSAFWEMQRRSSEICSGTLKKEGREIFLSEKTGRKKDNG